MKICGCKEECFEKGELWGHLSGIMCKNLSEKEQCGYPKSFCMKFKKFVECYFDEQHYKKIKGKEK